MPGTFSCTTAVWNNLPDHLFLEKSWRTPFFIFKSTATHSVQTTMAIKCALICYATVLYTFIIPSLNEINNNRNGRRLEFSPRPSAFFDLLITFSYYRTRFYNVFLTLLAIREPNLLNI